MRGKKGKAEERRGRENREDKFASKRRISSLVAYITGRLESSESCHIFASLVSIRDC